MSMSIIILGKLKRTQEDDMRINRMQSKTHKKITFGKEFSQEV